MIIDFHTHIFPDKIAERSVKYLAEKSGIEHNTDGTVAGLLKSMEEGRIDLSVVLPVATKPEQFSSITKFACFLNETYDNIHSFGGLHPLSENYKEELNIIKREGLKGVKLHPDYQGMFIDDIRYKRIIYEASALGLIVLLHAGRDIGYPEPVHCPPDRTLRVIEEIRPEKLVLAHLGGWRQWDAVEELLCGKNVWLDTAFCLEYISKEQFFRIIETHGFEKILFATDSPWSVQGDYVNRMEALIEDEGVRNAILGGNAERLLNGI